MTDNSDYDAVLLLSFGGPEGPDDVMAFLERVTAGRDVPADRLVQVARQYDTVDGVSPLNEHCRKLRRALQDELDSRGLALRVYWGNRNWHPLVTATVADMADDGVTRAIAIATSAYRSYSGCRQYLEDIDRARAEVGPHAPVIDKVRSFHDQPGWIDPWVDATTAKARAMLDQHGSVRLVFTAHSIPVSMAAACDYQAQLSETVQAVVAATSVRLERAPLDHALVFQSRSGPPQVPWLEPDVNDELRARPEPTLLIPIGFVSDHMEVVFDLDVQARETADELGIALDRVQAPGTDPDPRFVAMVADLVTAGPPDQCRSDCCPARGIHP